MSDAPQPTNGTPPAQEWVARRGGTLRELTTREDGALFNAASGLGIQGKDPRLSVGIQRVLLLSDEDVENLMQSCWQAQKFIAELPAESVRKWIKITVEMPTDSPKVPDADKEPDATPDEIEQEDVAKDVLDVFEDTTTRQKIEEALVFERQYGGAALVLGVNDAEDPSMPLDLERMRRDPSITLRFIDVFSRKRIQVPTQADLETDPESPRFGQPAVYRIRQLNTGAIVTVHWTRVIIFQGWSHKERERSYEFGISVLNSFWPSLRDYKSSLGHGIGIGSRMVETRLKMKGLMDMLTGDAEKREAIREAYQEIALVRSVFKMTLIDSEDEIEDAQLSFTGFAELIEKAREDLAAASGLSLQRFFGLTRAGLGDSDETGAERDDATVAAFQRDKLLPVINRLINVALASLGVDPETWSVEFIPLREETPGSRATRKKAESETADKYKGLGAIHEIEVRETLRADPDPAYQLREGTVDEAFPAPEPPPQPANLPPQPPVLPPQPPAPEPPPDD